MSERLQYAFGYIIDGVGKQGGKMAKTLGKKAKTSLKGNTTFPKIGSKRRSSTTNGKSTTNKRWMIVYTDGGQSGVWFHMVDLDQIPAWVGDLWQGQFHVLSIVYV